MFPRTSPLPGMMYGPRSATMRTRVPRTVAMHHSQRASAVGARSMKRSRRTAPECRARGGYSTPPQPVKTCRCEASRPVPASSFGQVM